MNRRKITGSTQWRCQASRSIRKIWRFYEERVETHYVYLESFDYKIVLNCTITSRWRFSITQRSCVIFLLDSWHQSSFATYYYYRKSDEPIGHRILQQSVKLDRPLCTVISICFQDGTRGVNKLDDFLFRGLST